MTFLNCPHTMRYVLVTYLPILLSPTKESNPHFTACNCTDLQTFSKSIMKSLPTMNGMVSSNGWILHYLTLSSSPSCLKGPPNYTNLNSLYMTVTAIREMTMLALMIA